MDTEHHTNECKVSGCNRSGRLKRRMCSLHYQRWKVNGTTERKVPCTRTKGEPYKRGSIGFIPLTKGKWAKVSCDDYESISSHKWYADNQGYAARKVWNKEKKSPDKILMHWDVTGGKEIDHSNGDKCDNRRDNLRAATRSQNGGNQKPRGGTSKFKGVYWNKADKRWMSRVMLNYRGYHLGSFTDEEDAAIMYNVAAQFVFGEFARLNSFE